MKQSEKHQKALSALEVALAADIKKHLKRIGRDFTEDDQDDMEFFTYSTPNEQDIESITKDGNVCISGAFPTAISILRAINEGTIPMCDAISILESLEEL